MMSECEKETSALDASMLPAHAHSVTFNLFAFDGRKETTSDHYVRDIPARELLYNVALALSEYPSVLIERFDADTREF